MRRCLLPLAALVLLALPLTAADKPVPAGEAAGRMTLPEGFHATLFAGEPDVVQPIAMTTDDRGRVWVVECLSYPNWSKDGKGEDRVTILEDTDGDGRHDKKTVFWDKGSNLSGITLGFGGVWLCSLPNLIFVPDRDGDDKPDGDPEILLDGWSLDCKHNVFNSLNWGPDGWLYGCNGITATSKVGRPGTPDKDRISFNCGVWRYHPTRKVFEPVAWGTTNPFGLDWDENGEMFITNCVIGHLWHVVPGGHYERMYGQDLNPNTYGLMKMCADHLHWAGGHWTTARGGEKHHTAGGGHAHSGCMIYLGDNFPDRYRNTVFMGNIHGNRINNDVLERQGSGYVARHGRDFMLSDDSWFRPIAMMYGPDGGVYVSDWSDTGECHDYEDIHRENGRIYKIVYGKSNGWKGDLAKLDEKELFKHQTHKNEWFVRHARRILHERTEAKKLDPACAQVFAELKDQARSDGEKLRLLWVASLTGLLNEKDLRNWLEIPESARAWVVRLMFDRPMPNPKETDVAESRLITIAEAEPSAVVRSSVASVLQRLSSDEHRWKVARQLVKRAEDTQDSNLSLLVWYGIESLASTRPDCAFDLLQSSRIPLIREYLARRIVSLQGGSLGIRLSAALVSCLKDDPAVQRDLLRGVLDALSGRRQVEMPEYWKEVYPILAQSPLPEVREKAVTLAVLFGDERALTALRKKVLDAKAPADERNRALFSLVFNQSKDLPPLLQQLLDDKTMRGPALRSLASFSDDKTPAAILKLYPSLTDDEKADAVHTLASRPAYALVLLDAVEKGPIKRADLSMFNVRALQALNDKKVSERLKEVWGEVRPASQEKAALMKKWKGQLNDDTLKKANLSNGRQLFAKNCASCHKLFDEGGTVGPELTGSQRTNLDYMLENLLDPSSLVGRDYLVTVVSTRTGRTITGIIKQETDKALTLQTQNEVVIVPLDEIDERQRSPVSMMPEGQLDKLTRDEVRDLIGYLASPVQVPLPPSPATK